MRTLITGDLHLSHNPRDAYRFAFMEWFADLAHKRKAERIIIAGDLTEEKDRHPAMLVNQVVEHVHALAEICPVVCLEGNHDYKDEGNAFFQFLNRIPNTRWISQPTVLADNVLLLPHTNDYKRDWGTLKLRAYPTIVCHQTFNGANVGFGRKLEGIPLSVLPTGSTTFCGDIHVPQEMDQLVYIGAPYHVDFGDDYRSSVIECNGSNYVRVDTSCLPQKRLFKIADAADLKRVTYNEGDLVEIKCEVDDMGGWQPLRDRIKAKCEKMGVRVWAIKPILHSKRQNRRHKVVADMQSDEQVVETYAKRVGLTSPTLRTGLNLLKS
jgi:predicted phosphodiesterase